MSGTRRSGTGEVEPVEAVLNRLRNRGGRITPGRRTIVQILLANPGHHLSAEQVVQQVRTHLPDTAESTIYRTLATLENLDVVSHVHLGHGPATYHLSPTPHRHLVCTRCGAVTDLPADAFQALADTVQTRYGFTLQDEHFALSGQCRHCHPGRVH